MVKLNNKKICCFSDVHIGVHQNNVFWYNVAQKFFTWVAQELKSRQIEDIIICGDLFHYRDEISVHTIHLASQLLAELKDFNIIMLVGNHDAYYKDRSDVNSLSPFAGWPNIRVISQPTSSFNFNRELSFIPWGTDPKLLPDSEVMFGHFEIETFKMNSHKICERGIKASQLLDKAKLVISGHFHLKDERKYAEGTILYLGSPYQMDFGDVESQKGIHILDLNTLKYEFVENDNYPKHKKILLSDLIKEEGFTDKVKDEFKDNIVKFIVDKNITADEIDLLLEKLSTLTPLSINVDYAVNFNKFSVQNDPNCDLSGVNIPKAIEEFVNMLDDINNKQEIIEYTTELFKRVK